ncbi:MAG: hypothetical protein A3B31_02580 [Candidatus Komeilibacteria bacterium RIFCSPLOWO2_01_FULL_53_11]|uniref:CheW-like domain-containing protein n=1 Tax=Candidatus Komeilibacteria bacterium RIFCSPLOWO2_01_FULL_53_11 TaxID=1798552 RepID=A0A1G2BPH4_9BACT|nr:MAG: hypothetical protein A3B31_02580 [Candidatus Komeilibacteria bacterium RIFCSPLOWO2_01_FULL_53_11]
MKRARHQPSSQTLLTFQVGERWFAVPLATVEGTGSLPSVTAIPGNASRVFLGLSYVLGQIMSVIDIAPLFNLGSRLSAKDLLILKYEGYYYAIIVSVVGEILTRPAVRPVRTVQSDAVLGVNVQKKRRIIVLDVPGLITRHVCS